MDFAICLDQFSTNFNVSSLSPNGFSIYTNLDYTNPIASGIPYQDLFAPPIGNCPLIVNVPQGATQILVIDACTTLPTNVAPIFNAGSSANSLITQCCYAIIPVPAQPISWCDTSGLAFDIFSSSYIGQIIAGDLTSTLGTVTDYKIGWYLDGDYSSPVFTSGKGTAFTPYQFTHPLTGNSAVPALAGDWEGIIHDIAINGTTYSSVSGSANGTPIPFESCFDTIVVDPLTCNNGPYSGSSKYSHQYDFNGLAAGASSSPVSFTYNLSPTTKYFALAFRGNAIWDEIEVKWNSGNPNATSNPSLYSQPIYLEKLRIGGDAVNFNNFNTPDNLYVATEGMTNNTPTIANFNNSWPKKNNSWDWWQKTLTLTNLETSSNVLTPDYLTITVSPNPSNNNTQWSAGFQCLDDFDCTDCTFSNYSASLPKIEEIKLIKQYGCDAQRMELNVTGCLSYSDFMGFSPNINSGQSPNQFGLNQLNLNLIGSNRLGVTPNFQNYNNTLYSPPYYGGNYPFIALTGTTSCATQFAQNFIQCGPSSTGTITYDVTPTQIQITCNLQSDYIYLKNNLLQAALIFNTPTTPQIPCSLPSGTNPYYTRFTLKFPIQAPTSQCGDGTSPSLNHVFNSNDYNNITYLENPTNNIFQITIPRTSLINCSVLSSCSNCAQEINNFLISYNNNLNSSISFTTHTGAKYSNPFDVATILLTPGNDASGSFCSTTNFQFQTFYWYGMNTIPFIPSSTSPTGWVNLPSLGASVPCDTSFYFRNGGNGNGTAYAAFVNYFQIRFPNLTGSFNYNLSTNDFEIYALAGFGGTGSYQYNINQSPLSCPDPSGSKIYSYIGGTPTVHTASYFVGGNPTLTIDP